MHTFAIMKLSKAVMNIKLQTPKSLKAGSGMSSLKQFLLSIVATSVSIALTFGTAAVIEHHKKKKAKREIVMMVMYDMYNSLQTVESVDNNIRKVLDGQRQIAEDTTKFREVVGGMMGLVLNAEYTETVERIFSSSIETINTVGNVFFTENVADFYFNRKLYKEQVCDTLTAKISRESPYSSLKGTLDLDFFWEAVLSNALRYDLRHKFDQCQKMMDVSDKELTAYRRQRALMEKSSLDYKAAEDSARNELIEIMQAIEEAKGK